MGNACRVSGGAFHPATCTKARDGAANGLDGYYGNRSMSSSFPRDMAASFDLVGVKTHQKSLPYGAHLGVLLHCIPALPHKLTISAARRLTDAQR